MIDGILIIADIEGSSGCGGKEASLLRTEAWAVACLEMTRDVDAVARALFDAGAGRVVVKDFHRTGYNLLREHLDPRVDLVPGYRSGPIPGIGDPKGCRAALFLGMHASSGSGGFLAHTLTSRIAELRMKGRLVSEVELFASSLAPFGVCPLFFSGCAVACKEAAMAIPGISVYPIPKPPSSAPFDAIAWREGLARAAVQAVNNVRVSPFLLPGPFKAEVLMRDGESAAARAAKAWNLPSRGRTIFLNVRSFEEFYLALIRLFYLTPLLEKILPAGLLFFNLHGRLALDWARKRLKKRSRQAGGR
jgi:D-amino peptidase